MFKHHLQTALRNLWRFKYTTAANVLCLAFGLSCFLLAYAVFTFFTTSDLGFKNADRIYVVSMNVSTSKEHPDKRITLPMSPRPLAKYLREALPELEAVSSASSLMDSNKVVVGMGELNKEINPYAVDENFLRIFAIPLLHGAREGVLQQPNSVLLSEQLARELFGTDQVVGKTLLLDRRVSAMVTGVFGKLPNPSHLLLVKGPGVSGTKTAGPAMLITWQLYDQLRTAKDPGYAARLNTDDWNTTDFTTYLLLPKSSSLTIARVTQVMDEVTERQFFKRPKQQIVGGILFEVTPVRMVLTQIVGLLSSYAVGLPIFLLLLLTGTLILGIALLNYVNLVTAQTASRRREIGLRRLLGSSGWQIAAQCALESMLACSLALLLALPVLELLLPLIGKAASFSLDFSLLNGAQFWLFLAALLITVTALASAYPAWLLSRVSPIEVVRSSERAFGRTLLSRFLVGVQFMAAGFMLVLMMVMRIQYADVRSAALARFGDPVVVTKQSLSSANVNFEIFKTELLKYPQVRAVSSSGSPLFSGASVSTEVTKEDKLGATGHMIGVTETYYDYFKTVNVSLLAGRLFDAEHAEDARYKPRVAKAEMFVQLDRQQAEIVNAIVDRQFTRIFGWKEPADALGAVLYGSMANLQRVRIVGVVENHLVRTQGNSSQAHAFVLGHADGAALIRIDKRDVAGGLAAIDAVSKKLAPDVPLGRQFADEIFEASYGAFRVMFSGLAVLAVLAFAISIMGMMGMAAHTVSRRTHEFGIRKSLGASGVNIGKLLLREFAMPIVIANLLAWPVAYLVCRAYLGLFPHRIALTPWPFLSSLAITVLIAWLSVSARTIRAARLKPAQVLRYE